MRRITIAGAITLSLGAAAFVPLGVSVSHAQSASLGTPADPALLAKGEALYTQDCAMCHQPTGLGMQPTFPALAGNIKLVELGLIVGNVHNGKNAMPAFPNLTAEEIAALATYVRNSWGNTFGGVSTEEVTTLLAAGGGEPAANGAAAPTAQVSIWDGVYTEEQAARGAELISGVCAKCHGRTLNGAGEPDQPPSPAIARGSFLRKWDGRTAGALLDYMKATMPKDNPGQLTDQEYADVIADMLAVSKVPAGTSELPADATALTGIVIHEKAP